MDSTQTTPSNQGQHTEDWQAYVPVENLVVRGADLVVGGARLYHMDAAKREELRHALVASLDATLGPPEVRAEMRDAIDKRFLPLLEQRACLQFPVSASKSGSTPAVLARAEEILALLRLYAAQYPPAAKARIGVSGRVLRSVGIMMAVSEAAAHIPVEATGAVFPCEIDAQRLQTANECLHLDDLSAAVAADPRTKYEQRLVTALQWLGHALEEDRLPEKVVALTTGLEALLLTSDAQRITKELAERVAIVLHDKLCERKRIKARMKKLYGLRSKVLHTGERNIAEPDARELELIVLNTLVRMAPRKDIFKTPTDLDAWFEDTFLG